MTDQQRAGVRRWVGSIPPRRLQQIRNAVFVEWQRVQEEIEWRENRMTTWAPKLTPDEQARQERYIEEHKLPF